MSTFYIDLDNGNDSNDGTSWATAWKTVTSGATAARIAPGDEIRISKTPDPVSIGQATWTDLSKTVTLAAALTQDIGTDLGLTSANGSTTQNYNTRKQGTYSNYVMLPSSVSTNTKYGYITLSELDLSGFQQLSFWLLNQYNFSANCWKICLCSDTTGDVVVDTFDIPAISTYGGFTPLTLSRSGGGNLGSSIKSIAIYTGSVSPGVSRYMVFDNFNTCTVNGLNLQSLISKNGNAQGGDEGFYAIQSIVGTTVLLDNDPYYTMYNQGRGYSGTTETVETYIRDTFKFWSSNSSDQANAVNDSGTETAWIDFSGGWNPSTGLQDGETCLDGVNGCGHGWYSATKQYWTLDYVNFYRFYYGTNVNNNRYPVKIKNVRAGNCRMYGVYLSGYNIEAEKIVNANNNYQHGVYLQNCEKHLIHEIVQAHNNSSPGIFFNNAHNGVVESGVFKNNYSYGVQFTTSNGNRLYNIVTLNNVTGGVFIDWTGENSFINPSFGESTIVSTNGVGAHSCIKILNDDGAAGNNWMYYYGSAVCLQSDTVHDTDPAAWRITNNARTVLYPTRLKIAEVAVNASSQVTATAWVKMSDVSLGAKLIVPEHLNLGIAETSANKAVDTDWEQLQVQFTPTVSGVVEIYLYSWVAGNVYLGSISISQA